MNRTHRFPDTYSSRQAGEEGSSIRQRLEDDAWRHHPDFARRQARRQQASRQPVYVPRYRRHIFRRWPDRALMIAWIVLTLLLVLRTGTVEAVENQYGMEFLGQGESRRSVATNTAIAADVTGMVARIDVRQTFRNDGRAWAEAIYRFPLPDGAAVDRLRVEAGGRVIEGEIQAKDLARRQYQQARADGRVAALVEQHRANQFETRLANIAPNDIISVSIGFLAHVAYREGEYHLEIPLTFTPRWDPPLTARMLASWSADAPSPAVETLGGLDDHRLTLGVRLRSGLGLARLESRYHDVDIHPTLGGYDVFVADPDTRTDRVFELVWAPELGKEPESALMTWDAGDAVYALLMLAPPLPAAIEPLPREVVFVIDTSGSMEGVSMRQAKAALYQGLDRLGPDDYFNLVRFDDESERLFDRSTPVDDAALEAAMEFIDGLEADGGTNMSPALREAMSLPALPGHLRQIVFVTDGSVGNEDELLLQIGEELGASRLFTVSIGSAPNSGFMRKAAVIGRGTHTHVGRLDEVAARIGELWQRIGSPALTDIRVDWGMDAEYYPEVIPDLYAGEPLWLFARLPFDPREIRLSGTLNGEYWEQEGRPEPGRSSANLATLWARARIESLEDSRVFGTDADRVRAEVTGLALEFGLLTAYTGMVAVAAEPARPAGATLAIEQVPSLLPAGSTALTAGFAATATGWKLQLLFASITLLIAAGPLWFSSPAPRSRAGGVLRHA